MTTNPHKRASEACDGARREPRLRKLRSAWGQGGWTPPGRRDLALQLLGLLLVLLLQRLSRGCGVEVGGFAALPVHLAGADPGARPALLGSDCSD